LQLLKSAESLSTHPLLLTLLADVYRVSDRPFEAERRYRQVLAREPGAITAHTGLAEILLKQTRFEEAAATALDATALDFGQGRSHFILGMALHSLNRRDAARQALRNCLQVEPDNEGARRLLHRMDRARYRVNVNA
jgi:tetratricopeptide (TPR) repeat protein